MPDELQYWFGEAVRLPPEDRSAFLKINCPQTALRINVLELLDHDHEDAAAGPQVAIPHTLVRRALGAVLREGIAGAAPVQRVGTFELGRLLGSGGMGLVYEAHRVDGEVRQRVAIKFAQVPLSASQRVREGVHRRFQRERQVLASLRHPYIAGLIDAGATEDGIPYAVIEQVDGEPIDSYCDAHQPSLATKIRLVLKLCDAVQFAHRNLIVHSDIKPDNVLVTADGIPKLIDFGVASDLSDDSTLTKARAFTPGYASPEQMSGSAPTVATDVYGLGALLYRLLTGVKPHDLKTDSLHEMIRHISEEDVVRPSTLNPELKGDLENILLKALQREPHRRYGSVPELADDLNRYLARRPVRATPDSMVYRARHFVRRHWASAVAAAALVATLATATVVSVQQRRQATRRAFETRRLADRLLFEVHDEIEGVLGATKARDKLGAIAVQYLEGLQRDHGRDPELAWELLSAYSRLGRSRGGGASNVGDTKGGSYFAMKTLELGSIVEAAEPDNERLDALFLAYEGAVPIFREAGQAKEQREAIERMIRLAPGLHPMREAQALEELARYQDEHSAPRQAVETFARGLAILRKLSTDPSKPAGFESQLITTLVGYGREQALAGDFSGSVASLGEAIHLAQAAAADSPHKAKSARQLYWSHIALGDVLGSPLRFGLERPGEAVTSYQKAAAIAEKLTAADPANDVAKMDLVRAIQRQAMALAAIEPERSLMLLEHAQALATTTSPKNYSRLDARYAYLVGSVEPLARLGHFDRAEAHTIEARKVMKEMRRARLEVNEASLLTAETERLAAAGRPREALAVARRHLALLPEKTNEMLSENFDKVAVLERIRGISAGVEPEACEAAGARLARIWTDLRAAHPDSKFVLARFDRALAMKHQACAAPQSQRHP